MADIIPYLAIIIGIINIGLLIGLFFLYINSYKVIKAQFTIGLVFFVSLLLLETIFNTLTTIQLFQWWQLEGSNKLKWEGVWELSRLAQDIFRCIAFSILYKISRK